MTTELDRKARYSVQGYGGVAWYIVGWKQKWDPQMVFETVCANCGINLVLSGVGTMMGANGTVDCDGSFDQHEPEEVLVPDDCGEGESVDDIESNQVVCTMVGDDREHTFDLSDLTKLKRSEYCGSCGQIGCGCDTYEEED